MLLWDWKSCTVFCETQRKTEVISWPGHSEHSGTGRGPSLGLQNYFCPDGINHSLLCSKSTVECLEVREAEGTTYPHGLASKEQCVTQDQAEGRDLEGWDTLAEWSCVDTMPLIPLPFFSNTWEWRGGVLAFLSVLILDWEKNDPKIYIHQRHYYPERTEVRLENEWQRHVSLAPVKLCTSNEITSGMTA